MAEPISEATSEEFLGTKEPTEEPPLEIPKQKQPRRCRGRRRCRRRHRRHQHLYRHRHGGCAHSFATYFSRVLKNVHQSLSLSQEAVSTVSFMKDIFERIADEASRLLCNTQRTTIASREIRTAVRLLLPGGAWQARRVGGH